MVQKGNTYSISNDIVTFTKPKTYGMAWSTGNIPMIY